jgi:hypothetical protein
MIARNTDLKNTIWLREWGSITPPTWTIVPSLKIKKGIRFSDTAHLSHPWKLQNTLNSMTPSTLLPSPEIIKDIRFKDTSHLDNCPIP